MAELYELRDLPPSPFPRPSPAVAIAVALFATGAVVYPRVAALAIHGLGVRGVSAVLLVIGAISLALSRRWRRVAPGVDAGPIPAVGVALLAVVAALTDDGLPLLLVPAWVYAVVAAVFWRSLADGGSLIEMGARFLHPVAPDFIRPYCRKVTWAWTVLFAGDAVVAAGLAVFAPLEWWQAFTVFQVFVPMVVLAIGEFMIRKWWFRYYPFGGIVDRVFSTLFPSQATSMGRRSHAYILEMRHKLATESSEDGGRAS